MVEEGKEIERVYVIPLSGVKHTRYKYAAPKAIKSIRGFLTRHMKVTEENVWIDDSVNKLVWAHGGYKIPSSIRVRAVKFEDGVVEASIPELGVKTSRRELLKEEREKKAPILRHEEAEEAPAGEGVGGAQDYTIQPSGDGDVKIKKKKTPKEEEEAAGKPVEEKKPEKKKEEKPVKEPAEKKKKTPKASKKTKKESASKSKRKSSAKKES